MEGEKPKVNLYDGILASHAQHLMLMHMLHMCNMRVIARWRLNAECTKNSCVLIPCVQAITAIT